MNWLFSMCWHANGNSPPKDNTIPRNLKLSDLFLFNFFFSLFSFPFDKFYQQTVCTAGCFPCFCMGFKPLLLFACMYTFSYRHNSNQQRHILGSTTFTVFFPTLPESWTCLSGKGTAMLVRWRLGGPAHYWFSAIVLHRSKCSSFSLKLNSSIQWASNNTFCIHCIILPAIAWPWKLHSTKTFSSASYKPKRWLIFYQTWCWCSEAKDKKRSGWDFPPFFF